MDPTKTIIRIDGMDGKQIYDLLFEDNIVVEKYTPNAIAIQIHLNII